MLLSHSLATIPYLHFQLCSLLVYTFKCFKPAKCLPMGYSLIDERSVPQLQSFLVGGVASSTASSTCSSTSITLLAHVPYPCTSIYLITWTLYLCMLCTRHYDIMVGWLVHRSRQKGGLRQQKGELWPHPIACMYYPYTTYLCSVLLYSYYST